MERTPQSDLSDYFQCIRRIKESEVGVHAPHETMKGGGENDDELAFIRVLALTPVEVATSSSPHAAVSHFTPLPGFHFTGLDVMIR